MEVSAKKGTGLPVLVLGGKPAALPFGEVIFFLWRRYLKEATFVVFDSVGHNR